MMLLYIWLVLTVSFIGAEGRSNQIVQTFPKNEDYCCHCPNIELHCTFSEPPPIAYWTVNGTSVPVTVSTPGHTAHVSNGALVLTVTEARYSSNTNYTCIAEYGNDIVISIAFPVPRAEGANEPISVDVKQVQYILNVTWQYEFPSCRMFTVLLDGDAVTGCTNITEMNCTVRDLTAGHQYTVVVRAESYRAVNSTPVLFRPNNPTKEDFFSIHVYIWPILFGTLLVLAVAATPCLIYRVKRRRADIASKKENGPDGDKRNDCTDKDTGSSGNISEKPPLQVEV